MYLKKIIGIFIMILFIASSIVSSQVFHVNTSSIKNSDKIYTESQTFNYDFIEHAPEASWFSWGPNNPSVQLHFDVPPNNPNWGYVGYIYDGVLEDGNSYQRVLHTHPYWVNEGVISGTYPQLTIPPDTELHLSVGFLQGAVGSDGVQFQVFFLEEGEQYPLLIANVTAEYDGILTTKTLPMSAYTGKTGRFTLRVYAGLTSNQDWAVWGKAELISTEYYYDLSIEYIEAVQVVYGAPLIKDKATVFRVLVDSTFSKVIQTNFSLYLPDYEWSTKPPTTGSYHTGVPPDYVFPKIWGPVPIAPGTNEIILPYIAPGDEDTDWSYTSNPTGIIRGREIRGVCGPDVRVMPRPKAEAVSVYVYVDEDNSILESNEYNNFASNTFTVVGTERFDIYIVLQIKNSTQNDLLYCGTLDCHNACCSEVSCSGGVRTITDVCSELNDIAKDSIDYLLGVLPVSDNRIKYTVDCSIKHRDDYGDSYTFMCAMIDLAKENGFDYVLAVQPWGRCGCCGVGWDGGYIELYGTPVNAAHELAGHGKQWIEYECYACSPDTCPGCTEVACDACGASEGFWVNKWIEYETGEWRVRRPTYYMDSVGSVEHRWQRLDHPWKFSDGTEMNGGYLQLIDLFAKNYDPTIAIISGMIYKNGEAELRPIKIIETGIVDIEPGESGDYDILLLDAQQNILNTFGFNVGYNYFTPEETIEMDKATFVKRIEWHNETTRIELRNAEGTMIAFKEVSPNKPEIQVIHPNGGENWEQGKTYEIQWDASDNDDDMLTYSLAISEDNGESWIPLDVDINEESYLINTTTLTPGENYIIKVRVTDGVNTEEDCSNAQFIILPDKTPPSISIEKPGNALYLNDNKIVPFIFPIIIGDITIEALVHDSFGIANVSFFIDDQLMNISNNPPFSWNYDMQSFGFHEIEIMAYDNNGNKEAQSRSILKLL
jgi:hypothetical protein